MDEGVVGVCMRNRVGDIGLRLYVQREPCVHGSSWSLASESREISTWHSKCLKRTECTGDATRRETLGIGTTAVRKVRNVGHAWIWV